MALGDHTPDATASVLGESVILMTPRGGHCSEDADLADRTVAASDVCIVDARYKTVIPLKRMYVPQPLPEN